MVKRHAARWPSVHELRVVYGWFAWPVEAERSRSLNSGNAQCKLSRLLPVHFDALRLLKDGSTGSVTAVSRSQPSFSSLRCSMATALLFASRLGRIWYSETQHR